MKFCAWVERTLVDPNGQFTNDSDGKVHLSGSIRNNGWMSLAGSVRGRGHGTFGSTSTRSRRPGIGGSYFYLLVFLIGCTFGSSRPVAGLHDRLLPSIEFNPRRVAS
jgi:hypothetical protein